MAVDKPYCMSSFLAYRYVYDREKEFSASLHHRVYDLHNSEHLIPVKDADEIDRELKKIFSGFAGKKLGLFLSGGMDSAVLASYMPKGSDAYTFRFLGGKYQKDELERAEFFAKYYGLNLHYVDISWDIVDQNIDTLMKHKGAPVHSIEPQLYYGALQAKKDGIELMIIGDAADYVFYGMDGLLSQDWDFESFYKRYIYLDPLDYLKQGVDMRVVLEKYRVDGSKIDFLTIYDTNFAEESYASYENAFSTAGVEYADPFEQLKMANPVDLARIRKGDSKYLVRDLFRKRYPGVDVPGKNPMPRPVDEYFKNWEGPTREEFKDNIDMSKLSGNQKWLLYCLERFLNRTM